MLHGSLRLKAQLMCGDEIAMGPGKADLLEAIARERSISAAGRALAMSYRRTWLLVDTMNRCWSEKLVETMPGGGHERGARVTEAGFAVLAAYRSLEAKIDASVSREYLELSRGLRATPLQSLRPQAR